MTHIESCVATRPFALGSYRLSDLASRGEARVPRVVKKDLQLCARVQLKALLEARPPEGREEVPAVALILSCGILWGEYRSLTAGSVHILNVFQNRVLTTILH